MFGLITKRRADEMVRLELSARISKIKASLREAMATELAGRKAELNEAIAGLLRVGINRDPHDRRFRIEVEICESMVDGMKFGRGDDRVIEMVTEQIGKRVAHELKSLNLARVCEEPRREVATWNDSGYPCKADPFAGDW